MDRRMRLGALPANAVDIRTSARGQNLIDLAKIQSRLQASGKADGLLRFALRHFSDSAESGMDHVDGESNRVRKFRIQQQKLGHPQWAKLGGISLAISLEGRARLQQSHPLQILFALDGLVR